MDKINTIRNYGLDIVRCVAIMMVLVIHSIHHIFHTSVPYFWYLAFGGVELFFSLSGFLIGRMLFDLLENTSFSLRHIYAFLVRRWWRTLPLYYILYFTYLIIYNLFLSSRHLNWRYLFFFQNMLTDPPGFFGESWSLSIEEWSYLLVPLLISFIFFASAVIAPFLVKKNRVYILSALIVILGMNIFRVFLVGDNSIDDKAVLFRLDAVAYGLVAAYFSKRFSAISNRAAICLGLVGLIIWIMSAGINMGSGSDAVRLFYYPLCGVGTSLIVLAFYYFSFLKKYEAVTYISKISYSVYLVHVTGILIPIGMHTYEMGTTELIVVLIISMIAVFMAASATYFLIEKPFLRTRGRLLSGNFMPYKNFVSKQNYLL